MSCADLRQHHERASLMLFQSHMSGTRKLKNLRENPHAAVLVDSGGTQKLLLISGPVEIIEKGEEYRRLYRLFHSRLSWVKRDPWKEGEAPFIKITPGFKTGWGLGGKD